MLQMYVYVFLSAMVCRPKLRFITIINKLTIIILIVKFQLLSHHYSQDSDRHSNKRSSMTLSLTTDSGDTSRVFSFSRDSQHRLITDCIKTLVTVLYACFVATVVNR